VVDEGVGSVGVGFGSVVRWLRAGMGEVGSVGVGFGRVVRWFGQEWERLLVV